VTTTPDVTVSIVSFNTRDLLRAAVTAALSTRGVSFEIIVADNGSKDGSAEMIEREFPSVHLVRNSDNRGFAAANNVVIRRAKGRYILLLNPDTEVNPETIPTLAGYLDAHPRTGICGPRILFPDGTFQSCGYRFPTVLSEIRQSKNVNKAIRALVGPETFEPDAHDTREVDWVDGACFMIRREVIEQIGPLDEQYFLYAEELDWCFNARKSGWAIAALPAAEMIHHLGQSSSQVSDRSLVHFMDTRLRYYRKNRGLATALFVSVVYVAGCLKQMRPEPHKSKVKLRAIRRWWGSLLLPTR
jgi:N-acetylglucosaminyl-diphospho-decaprenol L-rhamnosyltransferase